MESSCCPDAHTPPWTNFSDHHPISRNLWRPQQTEIAPRPVIHHQAPWFQNRGQAASLAQANDSLHSLVSASFPDGLMVKNPPANAGCTRDSGSIPGSGRSPGEGNGNPLRYSGLENPTKEEPDRLHSITHGPSKAKTDSQCEKVKRESLCHRQFWRKSS